MTLAPIDLIILAVPLVVVLVVTIYLQRLMRSVADFLAAGRCAGRYLICTSIDATGVGVMALIAGLEQFSKVGFSLNFWNSFAGIITFFMGVLGLIVYRFRETRALTFHQFFEMRYSKGLRIFASFINVFSGLFNFGLQPAVGARFFVYFCGLPERMTLGPVTVQTFIVVMIILMAVSMYFALTGGQITVIVTDCLEGVISSFFYLIVAIYIVCTLTSSQMHVALTSAPQGSSYIDPFDINGRSDFNGWFVVLSMLIGIYWYRGNAWSQGFAAAAKNAHEGRMAQIIGNWRGFGYNAMGVLVSITAFTMMHHPDFAAQRAIVEQNLQHVGNESMQNEMRLPIALGIFLVPGVKGCFLAVLLFGLISSQGMQLMSYGATTLQDVIMPFRKHPFAPKVHIRALRICVLGVAVFVCTFSALYKPVDYLVRISTLIGAIYLGGIGLVVWGGLYWKKGTTAGAWTSMIIGCVMGVGFNVVQQFWKSIDPLLVSALGQSSLGRYFAAHADRCPFDGVELTAVTAACAGTAYIIVSLSTCRKPFNMDEMLHRGSYRVKEDDAAVQSRSKKRTILARLVDIDEHFTWGDKVITYATVGWSISWKIVALSILFWSLFIGHISQDWWFNYTLFTGVWMTLAIGFVTTIWFAIGVGRDLKALFSLLHKAKRIDADDGTVLGHHNAGDPK